MEVPLSRFARLPIGTEIAAARDFGAIIEGQLGIITGHAKGARSLWWERQYVCTFLGDIRVVARTKDFARRTHGCSKDMLEDLRWFIHRDSAIHPYSPLQAWSVLEPLNDRLPAPAPPPVIGQQANWNLHSLRH